MADPLLDRMVLDARIAYQNGEQVLGLEVWQSGPRPDRGTFRRQLNETVRRIEAEGWDHTGTEQEGTAARLSFTRSQRPPSRHSGCALIVVALAGAVLATLLLLLRPTFEI